jgi:hypothetical protein
MPKKSSARKRSGRSHARKRYGRSHARKSRKRSHIRKRSGRSHARKSRKRSHARKRSGRSRVRKSRKCSRVRKRSGRSRVRKSSTRKRYGRSRVRKSSAHKRSGRFGSKLRKKYNRKYRVDSQSSSDEICPICQDNFTDPVRLQTSGFRCNHKFCKECIRQWFRTSRRCPFRCGEHGQQPWEEVSVNSYPGTPNLLFDDVPGPGADNQLLQSFDLSEESSDDQTEDVRDLIAPNRLNEITERQNQIENEQGSQYEINDRLPTASNSNNRLMNVLRRQINRPEQAGPSTQASVLQTPNVPETYQYPSGVRAAVRRRPPPINRELSMMERYRQQRRRQE